VSDAGKIISKADHTFFLQYLENGSSQSFAISYIQSRYLLLREKEDYGEGKEDCISGKGDGLPI
jgi:hypothetical protein